MAGKRGGRPPEMTPDVQELVIKGMLAGNYLETAAAAAGVSSETVRRWVYRGNKEFRRRERGLVPKRSDDAYVDFAARFVEAEAQVEAGTVLKLSQSKNERTLMDFLERRFPKRWGSRINVIVEEELREFIGVLRARLDPETFQKVIRAADGEADSGRD